MTIKDEIHALPHAEQSRAEAMKAVRDYLNPANVRRALRRDRAGSRTGEVSTEFPLTECEFWAAVEEPEVRRLMDTLEAEGVHVLVSDYATVSSPKRSQAICVWLSAG